MNERIGIYMRVFRNEPEIHRAVKSVLNQTYTNWKFYVVVNEKTESVIKSYAERDDRITVIPKPDGPFPGASHYLKEMSFDGNDYVCSLDGDDELDLHFLEKMLNFSKEFNTDISFCGYSVHNLDNTINPLVLSHDYVWDIEQTNEVFVSMYQFFRTNWATLYSSEMIRRTNMDLYPSNDTYGGYGGDTLYIFNCLYFSKRCGYLSASLYNYYLSDSSDSHVMNPGRLTSDLVLYNFVRNFLTQKSLFSHREDVVLHLIYAYALVDTIKLVLKVENDPSIIYKDLLELLSAPLTRETVALIPDYAALPNYDYETGNPSHLFFREIFTNNLVLNLPAEKQYNLYTLIGFDQKHLLTFDEYRFVMLFPDLLALYHFGKQKSQATTFFNILSFAVKNNKKTAILDILKKLSTNQIEEILLSSEKCIYNNKDIYITLHNKQFSEALQLIKEKYSTSENVEYSDELTQIWILCAATIEAGTDYILGKKIRTEFLAQCGRKNEATTELKDIFDMGINDSETVYLQSLIDLL